MLESIASAGLIWQRCCLSSQANNDQQEYYLTDAVNQLEPVMAFDVEDYQEILGINDRQQLATVYEILQTRVKEECMAAGVTLINPTSITIDDTVQLQPDVIIEPQTHLQGQYCNSIRKSHRTREFD